MNTFYKSMQMPQDFLKAVEVIQQYCQYEDCDENCNNCPYSLTTIRCGDTDDDGYVKRPTGDWIWQTENKYQCSCCGEVIRIKEVMNEPQYITCPMCDARMVEPQGRSK